MRNSNATAKATPNAAAKPIHPIRQRLMLTWLAWLIYRCVGIAVLFNGLLASQPSIAGGVAWQGLWLIPAFVSTPFMVKGKSPYALLVINMLTLVYWGGSGMVMLIDGVAGQWGLFAVWLGDFLLLTLINYWLFVLLKRLPKMNG